MGEPPLDEKTKSVLEVIGVKDVSTATREQVVLALGRLLSVKASKGASVHEVTKDVRRVLELALMSPIVRSIDEALVTAVYTDPPFKSNALNRAYRELLKRLLAETMELARELSPMWRRRLVNLTIENLYNIATGEAYEYRSKIFDALKEELEEEEVE
ncbi:MAG: hypothetical protein QXD36_01265 [Sulfolobales archaeon]